MDLLNKSMPVLLRMNTLFLFSIQKPSTTVKDTSCLSFGLITMSVSRISFYLRMIKTLLRRLFKDSELHKRYAETKREEMFVLLHFRQHKHAVSEDMGGMFLQVGVLDQDQSLLRFLWLEDPTSDVKIHQYTRHIIGASDSRTRANFVWQKTANSKMSAYPDAASGVTQKIFMNDYLNSF